MQLNIKFIEVAPNPLPWRYYNWNEDWNGWMLDLFEVEGMYRREAKLTSESFEE
jgi:hypothetical protein